MVRFVLASVLWMHTIKTWDSINGGKSLGLAINSAQMLKDEAFKNLCDIAWPSTIGKR